MKFPHTVSSVLFAVALALSAASAQAQTQTLTQTLTGVTSPGQAEVVSPAVIAERNAAAKVALDGSSLRDKTVAVKVGALVEIRLEENLSTGQSWRVSSDNGGVGHITHFYEPGKAMPGAPGNAVFAFVPYQAGTTLLVFHYGRRFSNEPASDTVQLTIEVR